ncbi:MAG: T9SS type A sorting domain-containing protein, partial [Bacteroidota bacterium]
INQYRIKQVDNDGKYSYSKILFVKMVSLNPLKVIANPAKENATINIGLETAEVKTMELYDLYGRKIKTYVPRNGNQLINVQGIADGKYLLVLFTAKGEVYSQPLMILK